ncbi:MAG: acyl-CoA thioesterase [Chitinophagales bacterium]|nr:acyl-CoA thioesterase [Chitinophagales bacterium]
MSDINLSVFRFKVPIEIRFSDFDLLNHVNNATYLTYLEEARIKYFTTVINETEVNWREEGMILARMEIDFKQPIFGYRNYFVNLRCSRLGNKSFDFECVITKEENETTEIIAVAKNIMVCFDYANNKTVEIKSEWREKVKAFEEII